MAYQLFDAAGKEIKFHDLQDKGPWCQTGASIEQVFVSRYGATLDVSINPQKSTNIYAPDLIEHGNLNALADLKTQNTPFFQATQRFELDPQMAVVFNKKDADRYSAQYPNIAIFFWVEWVATRFVSGPQTIQVQPMSGVWKIPFQQLIALLHTAPLHSYAQRMNDNKGNARSSYVLNLSDPHFVKVI